MEKQYSTVNIIPVNLCLIDIGEITLNDVQKRSRIALVYVLNNCSAYICMYFLQEICESEQTYLQKLQLLNEVC